MSRTMADSLARLAIARGAELDDFANEVYLDSLRDLDTDIVRRACELFAKQPRAEYESPMPTVGSIREACAVIVRDDAELRARKMLAAPLSESDEPKYFCLDCRDEPNGWRPFECRGTGPQAKTGDGTFRSCGRIKPHAPHSFVERCACLPYNPEIAKHRERMNAATQRRAEKASHR